MEASISAQQQADSRVGREAHEGTSGSGNKPTPTTQLNGRNSDAKCQQQGENDPEQLPATALPGANGCGGGEPNDAGTIRGGREDECLGLLAEAFADDLDLLRQESTFTGSSKNIAAMADMMR